MPHRLFSYSLALGLLANAAWADAPPAVAIDVGHSLAAPGARAASGATEFSFNQRQARLLQQALSADGVTSRLIGEAGDMTPLTDRTLLARQQRLFVSVHHDSVQPQYLPDASRFHGYSVFVSRKNPYPAQSLACAREVARALSAAGETPTLHHAEPIAGENRPLADASLGIYWFDDLVVLKTARQPALLVEHGVIVNPQEEARLMLPDVENKLARAVADGLRRCLLAQGITN
ncbi:MAG: N-acetylmuramoyl-L-alanine amidase [Paludibacterium sp.]|uniref:N-acetylmuramoyl-L-alanine amidase family protein n=1 Tax=Paludibacterium sp. TaxID=1917523 RepID=UPI0025D7D1B9|nr:N-acetylmuramoyl-L-alanine amidase [Paludibacterium sp.]MBV8049370.1 N-acetylmuramoyl-L-alanine amidase [Paludibacterium sp.]